MKNLIVGLLVAWFSGRVPKLLMLSVMVIFAVPDFVSAATFTVQPSNSDQHDRSPGDGHCADFRGVCTLRAAIEESNATPGRDVINLPAGKYVLTLGELVIDEDLTIRGGGAGTITSDGTIIGGTIIDGNRQSRVLTIGLDLLVCDAFNNSVLRYGAQSGRFIDAFVPSGSGGLDLPLAATLGPDNDLFVGGFSSGVHRYDRTTGAPKGRFTASSSGALLQPVALGFDGQLFVADFLGPNFLPPGGILRFDEGTNAFIEFVPPGSGGLASPNSLAFGLTQNLAPNNRFALYVGSVGPRGDGVLRYERTTDPEGPFTAGDFIDTFVSAPGRGNLGAPRSLAFGPDRNLYVTSELNDRILRYDATTGAFINTFVSAGSGGLDRPIVLTFGPHDDNLYVISHSNGGAGAGEVLRFDGRTGAFIDTFIPAGRGGLGSAGCLLFAGGVGTGPTVNIIGVTIQNGDSNIGGGILIFKGSRLFLTSSIVNNNLASNSGAGIFNEGTLNVTESTITRNGEPERGGGGIKNNGGTATLSRSTVDNNSARGGGFTGGGGIENTGGRLTITNSTISDNELTGGVSSRGGGINNESGATLNLTNVTIANNRVAAGFQVERRGGGIFNEKDSTANVINTIIDGNSAGTGPDCFGTLRRGFNLISNTTDCNITGTNILNRSAKLDELAPNGGPTWTHALSSTSPAIDKGNNNVCPAIDQRGFSRPFGAACDIGAFEFGVAIVNSSFAKKPTLSTPTTSPGDTSGCPSFFFGKFSFEATFTNTKDQKLSNLVAEVTTLTNENLLITDVGPGGVGARLTVPKPGVGDYSDGVLSLNESVNVPFVICLKERKPFSFFVDVLGVVQ